MALVVKDRVKQFSTTSGTGTLTLGATPSGFQDFSVVGDGNTTYYAIVDPNTGDWEVGLGTYTLSGTTLSRDTVLESSNSGSLVNFSADSKDVFVTYPAEKAVLLDDVQTLTNKTINGSSNTITNVSLTSGVTGTLPVANGGTGITSLGAGVATFLGIPSSANLAAAVTGETGSGALVFATSPTLVTPALGTPSSGNLANCTFPTLNQNTTGNAATATALQTARTINGVSFNGTANITINTMPIGAAYIQFPGYNAPNTVFGGTWSAIFDSEGIFFRTPGGNALSFGGGIQADQMQTITGSFRIHGDRDTPVSGAFSNIQRDIRLNTWGSGGGDTDQINFTSANSPGARTGTETRSRNRTVRVWVRTA
jgi:hypothetical protein